MVENSSPVPLYHQVSVVLRNRILEGAFAQSGLLPTEKQIEMEFGVSRISVRKAVDLLVADGLVERRAGRGTIILAKARQSEGPTTSNGPFENLLSMGHSTDVAVLDFGYEAAGASIASALEVEVGETVQRAVRVRSHKDRPFSYLTTWIPEAIGVSFTRKQLQAEPILDLLERAGARPESASQCFSAASADPAVARALDVAVASPLLSIQRIVRDGANRPVEYLQALYPPERYRYVSTLSRNSQLDGPFWLTTPEDRA